MPHLRTHRLLGLLVLLLFTVGHGHQVLGQYELHCHHGNAAERCESARDVPDRDSGDGQKEADCMLKCHGVVAVVTTAMIPIIVALHSVAVVDVSAEVMPEPPVAGIDHPPQLVG